MQIKLMLLLLLFRNCTTSDVDLLPLVVMKTGIRASFIPFSKIPLYASNFKKEYLYIRGLNQDLKYFLYKAGLLNQGLFETENSNRIKYNMKRFLRSQEKGKINDISKFKPDYDIIGNFIEVNKHFDLYKYRYDYFCEIGGGDVNYDSDGDVVNDDGEYLVDGKPYPGFIEIYDIFKMIFNQIQYEDCESDSDIDIDIDDYIFAFDEYNSDSDSDSDSD